VAELTQRIELLTAADVGGGGDIPLVEEEIVPDETAADEVAADEAAADEAAADETVAGEPAPEGSPTGPDDADAGDAGAGGDFALAEGAVTEPETTNESTPDAGGPSPAGAPSEGGTDSAPSGDPQALYDEALTGIMNHRPEDALVLFSRFVNEYPDHELTDNAYYWLGESYYSLGDYESAARHFRVVTDSFADRDKAPDAQLKLGYSLVEMGRTDDAVDVLTDLINRYPGTHASELAREKLSLL
jgi:tol-pal system protein YbgF